MKTLVTGIFVGLGLTLAAIQPVQAAPATAQISLNPSTGPAGSAATVSGTGFKVSTTGTGIAGSSTFAFKTASSGAFSTTITIPATATGSLTITAKTSSVKASSVFKVAAPGPTIPPVSTAALRFGVATAGGPLAGTELDEVSQLAGERPSSVLFYKDFLQAPPIRLFPGAGYVDIVALDGYNWGTSASWSGWISPQDLFAPGIAQLRTLAPGAPILIAETASSEAGGSKAAWNTELVTYLAAQPDVQGFVWFLFRRKRTGASTAPTPRRPRSILR
ncbi:hypothetical protein [Arthrobacter oryzae]|uniref:hypothetical protein n=1 Tax=Arthrobacter oryzae TaxID=409290 RepID=UPI00277F3B1D|nr:hypothetical protein [Arthrobacter oryzae]MDQ0076961.1 hypothetical protein [Arthrobacter oryzae]